MSNVHMRYKKAHRVHELAPQTSQTRAFQQRSQAHVAPRGRVHLAKRSQYVLSEQKERNNGLSRKEHTRLLRNAGARSMALSFTYYPMNSSTHSTCMTGPVPTKPNKREHTNAKRTTRNNIPWKHVLYNRQALELCWNASYMSLS